MIPLPYFHYLSKPMQEEQLSRYAYQETLDTEYILNRELEERGSIYGVGDNSECNQYI